MTVHCDDHKDFRSMLLGTELHIHTDHNDLTFNNLQTQRVLRWRCFVEEYNPTLHYIPVPKNTITDTFSHLHRKDNDMTPTIDGKNAVPFGVTLSAAVHNTGEEAHYSLIDDHELSQCFFTLPDKECYLNLPHTTIAGSPLNFETLKEKQLEDNELRNWTENFPDRYLHKHLGAVTNMLVYIKPGHGPETQWKIVLPRSMIKNTINWFHLVT